MMLAANKPCKDGITGAADGSSLLSTTFRFPHSKHSWMQEDFLPELCEEMSPAGAQGIQDIPWLDSQRTETPELNPTFPYPQGCLVFQCGAEGKAEKSGFSPFGEHLRAFTQLYFSRFISCSNTEQKGETQLLVSIHFLHCLFLPFFKRAGVDGDGKGAAFNLKT